MHSHRYEPCRLVHVATSAHVCVPSEHSSSDSHDVPLPFQPALHAHVKLPTVLEHVAWTSQL